MKKLDWQVAQKGAGGFWFVYWSHAGKRIWRATGTTEERVARKLAPKIKERWLCEHYRGIILPADPLPPAASQDTLRPYVEAYLAANKRASGVSEKHSVRCLRRIVLELTGCAKGQEDDQPVTVLRRAAVLRWQALRQGLEGAEPDLATRRPCNITANSYLRNARQVFGLRTRSEALDYSPFEGFLNVPLLPTPRKAWNPGPIAAYKELVAAGDALKGELWLVHQMLRRLGLRAGELKAAKREWLRETPTGWALAVEDDGQFQIKGAGARVLPLPDDLAAILKERSGYLIRAKRNYLKYRGKTQIVCDLIDSQHSAFVRQWLPVRNANHELRKWVGAILYSTRGAEVARQYLGHSEMRTLLQHYSAYLAQVDVSEELARL